MSNLLLTIREVDEVIHVEEEVVFAGLLSGGAQFLCDSFSKPIVAE